MDEKLKAYVAGPDGFSESGKIFHKDVFLPLIRESGIEVIDPWQLDEKIQCSLDKALLMPYSDEKIKRLCKINRDIGLLNEIKIKNSDLIIANLDGKDVDSGTAAEIGFGYALGKFIEGYRSDFRVSGDNCGGMVNLQVEYFIRKSGGDISISIDKLKNRLELLVGAYNCCGTLDGKYL
jgi:nucleoside 2-deoxyribosyltransferase